MYQKTSDKDFEKAVKQLGLKVRDDDADIQQLKYILLQILGYPSVEKAQQHHKSNIIGTNDLLLKQMDIQRKVKQKNISDFQICNCCGLLLQNQQLPFTTKLSEINLGIGVYLFFFDFLYYAVVFVTIFFIYSIYAIVTNSNSFNSDQATKQALCTSVGCGLVNIGAGSKVLSRTEQKNLMSRIQCWIGIGVVILWGLFQIIKTHFQQKLVFDLQTRKVSASDFTLMIQAFPKIHLGTTQDECLKLVQDIFNQYYQSQKLKRTCLYSYEVVSVNIARSLYKQSQKDSSYKQRVKDQLYNRQDIFRNWIKYRKQNNKFPLNYNGRSRIYQDYNNYFSEVFQKQIFPKIELEDKNIIFVTMRYSKAREQIQYNNAPGFFFKFLKLFKQSDFPIQGVTITKAPQPQQIKWQNIGFPSSNRNFRRFLAWLGTIGLIIVSLALSIGISYIKQKSIGISIGISIVVTLVNLGIQLALIYFSSLQYQIIQSWEQSSIAVKIGIGQLVNSICVPIVVTAISKQQQITKPWLKANGLADDVFFIAILNLLVPFSTLIDPYEHLLRLKRWWKSKPEHRLNMYGQIQLNDYYGNYKLDIGYQYAFLIKTVIFTAFFLCIQPMIALFAPVALLFYYLADKRNLFHHFKRPGYHFSTTNNAVDRILLLAILAFALGSLFVNNANPQVKQEILSNQTQSINIIMIAISVGFLIIVPLKIFYCCIRKPTLQNKDYLQKRMLLYTDYDRTNPITKNSAISQFEQYIRSLELETLPDEVRLVKIMSTIQMRQTKKPQNHLRQSYSRMSVIRQSQQMIPSKSLIIQPEYNYDRNFYQQIVHQNHEHKNNGKVNSVYIDNEQGNQQETLNHLTQPKFKQYPSQGKQHRGQ